jgi:hypothetical protein
VNFFLTHLDPLTAARQLDDKRVQKIALEVTQVLSVVLLRRGIGGFYRPCHQNHPVTLWAGADPRNTAWAWRYGKALCQTYLLFGKKPVHSCEAVLDDMRQHIKLVRASPSEWQNSARNKKWALDFTHLPVVPAYRCYLNARWPNDKNQPVWTGRPRPRWAGTIGEVRNAR